MRAAFATLLAMICAVATGSAGDWRETLTSPQPGKFPLPRPLKARYVFGWSAFHAAEVEADFSREKSGELQLKAKARTVGPVRGLWRLDADHTSRVRAENLQPVTLVQNESYSDETRKTSVAFGPKGASRKRDTVPKGKDSGKTKRFKFAPVFDLHAALLFIRSQPLEPGDVIRLATYPAAQAYHTEVEVVGREMVTVAKEKRPALKLGLRLQKISKNLKLERHKKFKRAYAWLSDDEDRLLLKVEADVMVGKVWMELESAEFL